MEHDDGFTFWPQHLREADVGDWCELELGALVKLLDPTRSHYAVGDLGRVSDLSRLAPLALRRTGVRTPLFVVEMKNLPFDWQGFVIHWLSDRLPRFSGASLGAATAEAAA